MRLERYRHSPAIEYAEPNYLHQLAASPNDTQFTSLWGLRNTGQNVNGTVGTADVDIDAPEAWDITTGSSNVIIGVIDSGIAYDHPDLAANMWKNPGEIPNDGIDNDGNGFVDDVFGYDFRSGDSEPMDPISLSGGNVGHGTHVAGTIGAVGNNNVRRHRSHAKGQTDGAESRRRGQQFNERRHHSGNQLCDQ